MEREDIEDVLSDSGNGVMNLISAEEAIVLEERLKKMKRRYC